MTVLAVSVVLTLWSAATLWLTTHGTPRLAQWGCLSGLASQALFLMFDQQARAAVGDAVTRVANRAEDCGAASVNTRAKRCAEYRDALGDLTTALDAFEAAVRADEREQGVGVETVARVVAAATGATYYPLTDECAWCGDYRRAHDANGCRICGARLWESGAYRCRGFVEKDSQQRGISGGGGL